MAVTICRSLWGDGQLTFFKAARDVVEAVKAGRPTGRVYVYGGYAKRFLALCGIDHHELPDKVPSNYRRGKSEPASMWWHKMVAIRQCLIDTGGPVIHLDWDTRVLGPIPEDLESGPAFQGRLRWYKRPQSKHQPRASSRLHSRMVYHGGCMYFRDLETIDKAIRLHSRYNHVYADEAGVTHLADRMCRTHDARRHRRSGVDNPSFYSTSRNVLPDKGAVPAFAEGPLRSASSAIPYVTGLIAATRFFNDP